VSRSPKLAVWLLAAGLLPAGAVRAASGAPAGSGAPRTLIVALDGVPYRVVQRARELGAFAGWPETKPLISTFPSMTNVGFAALLSPFGADPVAGYELRRYERERNAITSQRAPDGVNAYDWTEQFQAIEHGLCDRARMMMMPRTQGRREMKRIEELVTTSKSELMLGYISATDPYIHFHRDEKSADFVLELAQRIEALRQLHAQRFGRPLHVVIVSDHGNHEAKVRIVHGLPRLLREAGLDPSSSLRDPDDVVAVTYGVVGYCVLFVAPALAEKAALAVLGHEDVELVAWRSAAAEITVASHEAQAKIRWSDRSGERVYAYDRDTGDPLRLSEAANAMAGAGLFDERGFATRDAWFDHTALGDFPDAPARLVDSLSGTWVAHAADVIVSFRPGWAWGIRTGQVAAALRAGRLEQTHGGLDRESTQGVYLSSEGRFGDAPAVREDRALAEWAGVAAGLHRWPGDLGCACSPLHAPHVMTP